MKILCPSTTEKKKQVKHQWGTKMQNMASNMKELIVVNSLKAVAVFYETHL